MAGAPGFEPGDGGTKNRCLTAWLRPNTNHGEIPWRLIRLIAARNPLCNALKSDFYILKQSKPVQLQKSVLRFQLRKFSTLQHTGKAAHKRVKTTLLE